MTTTALTHSMTEDQLLTAITEAAAWNGWLVHHIRRSDKALQMGNPGFPDLVLAKAGRLYFLELKTEKGKLSPFQAEWFKQLESATGNQVQAVVVRPSDLDTVIGALSR